MNAKERKFLMTIFKRLEKVTNKFTKEDGIGLSDKSSVPKKVVAPPKNFKGFSANPTVFLRNQLQDKYPAAQGKIIFFLQDDFIAYIV